MALTQKLEFRQSQALVMTPQLMQAIKLLQLSNLDLVAYVEGELERNPLLDRTDAEQGRGEPEAAAESADGKDAGATPEWLGPQGGPTRAAIEDGLDTNIENVFPDAAADAPAPRPASNEPAAYSEWAAVGGGGREDGDYNLEAFVSAQETLADHLAEQLFLAIVD